MKPKRLLMVHHLDGRTEYICKNCGQKMDIRDDHSISFRRGEVEETGGEFLKCEKCGTRVEQFPVDMHKYISNEYGWADLDEANKLAGHYQNKNGKPDWLIKAKNKLDQLCKREIEIIDNWEKGQAHDMDVAAIQLERERAQCVADKLYEFWNASFSQSEGTHDQSVANQVPEWKKSTH